MFSKVTSRITGAAVTGLFLFTIGAGIITGGGVASAQQNDGGGTPGEGATGCTYASKTYSEGSKVKQDDGNIYRCHADGHWVLALVAPPTGTKLPKAQTGGVFQRAQ